MAKSTRQPGDTNNRGHVMIAKICRPGTDHNATLWHMRCAECEHEFGANGTDFHNRRCPACQYGAPGLALT